jgi:hypothetical protein
MAADEPDRDDEAPRTSDAEPGAPDSAVRGSAVPGSAGRDDAGRDDAGVGTPEDDGSSDLGDERPATTGETREQSVPDDQTLDGVPSVSSAGTEVRPVPPDVSRPDRVGPGTTGGLPPVDDVTGSPRWSARASVRTPDVVEEEHHDFAEPPRGLLVPLLVTVCILLLVALIGLGSWLIFASRPSGTPTATPTVQNATPPATTAGQTATTMTSPPRIQIPLPDLRGLDYETAAAELTKLGFVPVRRDEIDGEVPKGKVVGTDPPVGTPVFTGTSINVIVSLGLPNPTTPPAEPTPTPSSTAT